MPTDGAEDYYIMYIMLCILCHAPKRGGQNVSTVRSLIVRTIRLGSGSRLLF